MTIMTKYWFERKKSKQFFEIIKSASMSVPKTRPTSFTKANIYIWKSSTINLQLQLCSGWNRCSCNFAFRNLFESKTWFPHLTSRMFQISPTLYIQILYLHFEPKQYLSWTAWTDSIASNSNTHTEPHTHIPSIVNDSNIRSNGVASFYSIRLLQIYG